MSKEQPLRTIIIGFGKIGAGYADDPVMAKYYQYATHSQVLAEHPAFLWEAVVEPDDTLRAQAGKRWGVCYSFASIDEVAEAYQPEVAVIATPPSTRLEIVKRLPGLRGVLVEKPLGENLQQAKEFISYCHNQEIKVQVNLWRRADPVFRTLANGALKEKIGETQAVFGLYGNGLLNNGTHMVDFVRMLFGEVQTAQALGIEKKAYAVPLLGDMHIPFHLRMKSGLSILFQPLNFNHYRENSLDIWGELGRYSINQEGLGLHLHTRRENRAMHGEREVPWEHFNVEKSTVGSAFYHMYSNLAEALHTGVSLWSSGGSALKSSQVIEAVSSSAKNNGEPVSILKE